MSSSALTHLFDILRNEPTKAVGLAGTSGFTSCGGPASAMESELLAYRQKMEQMTAVIRHYQSELESQKIRRDGVETVSRLLAECRQENASLKKQHAASQMMVKNLQNKLASCGLVPSSEGDDNDVIVPGTSKQTLTNLALENKRLRSLLQQENSADSREDLQKTPENKDTEKSLQQTVVHLEAENKSMKRKLSDLEHLFKSSNNEKDRHLLQCQEEIQRLAKQNGETSAHKTTTALTALKEHLKGLMAQCASFELHLESVGVAGSDPEKKGPAVEPVPSVKQVERSDSVDGVGVEQLLAEKEKLQARVEEVTQMNQRWQEFFSERDRYTKRLEQKVQDLEGQLRAATHHEATPDINRHIGNILEKSQKELEQLEDKKKKAEEEAERLRQEVVVKETQVVQLQGEVSSLKQASRQPTVSEAQGIIEHLKAQIQVCTEDFEKEREDRQIALHKVSGLQEQNKHLHKLNDHLQTLLKQSQRPIVQEPSYHDTTSLLHHSRALCPQSVLAFDSPSSPPQHHDNSQDCPDFDFDNSSQEPHLHGSRPVSLPVPAPALDLLCRGLQKPKHSLSDSAIGSGAGKKDTFLTCPKCSKEFSEECQDELLTHMDVCWE